MYEAIRLITFINRLQSRVYPGILRISVDNPDIPGLEKRAVIAIFNYTCLFCLLQLAAIICSNVRRHYKLHKCQKPFAIRAASNKSARVLKYQHIDA